MFKKLKRYFKNLLFPESLSALSMFSYTLNDPSTPELTENIEMPTKSDILAFNVYNIDSNDVDIRYQANNCSVSIFKTIQHFQRSIVKWRSTAQNWAAAKELLVIPRAGINFNAYYDRFSLRFFYNNDKNNKVVYASDSADIISHETGHALLDVLRPDLWNTQYLEIWAFHEAFGDCMAMLTVMQSDIILKRMLEETNGKLMLSNITSRLAEQFGVAIDGKPYLRDASIEFGYIKPEDLGVGEIKPEAHSFSRIFSSAWYKMFVAIFDKEISNGTNNLDALKISRDICENYLLQAVQTAPRQPRFFESIAKNILALAKIDGSKYYDDIYKVFLSRGIINEEIKILSNTKWEDLRESMNAFDNAVIYKKTMHIMKRKDNNVRLRDHLFTSQSARNNPLFNLEIEAPLDSFYHFNEQGDLVYEIHSDADEALKEASLCVNSIYKEKDWGEGKDSMWRILNGKLIRRFVE